MGRGVTMGVGGEGWGEVSIREEWGEVWAAGRSGEGWASRRGWGGV